ncbi:MAG: histidine kinase [Acidobacteriota bacterium]|nr:histidine kinase [Acidobacteriota bacterium]
MTAWVPIGAILILVVRLSGQLTYTEALFVMTPAVLVMAFVCLSPYYVCRSLPLRSAPVEKVIVQHSAAAFILTGGLLLVARFAASVFTASFRGLDERFSAAVPMLALVVLMIYCVSVALHYAALELESSRQSEILAREAQLKALKAQVNPHFLFNSLNSISALTSLDATQAREMCVRLADFLRTSLRLGERVTVSFAEELALTRMYLDVEQVRFGGKLRLHQKIESACSDCEIPALLIQPLVENAVKHGIAMMAEGGEIALCCRRDHDHLRFSISNPFDPEAPSTGRNGLGLRNIRDRLESRYGGAARMEIKVEERLYSVTLTLPVRIQR